MKASLWAEIWRLHEMEKLSQRAISERVNCCHRTVAAALSMTEPPSQAPQRARKKSKLDPFKPKIQKLIAQYPDLSAVRIHEEISKGDAGYRGGITIVKEYVSTLRPARGRVYREVFYDPGEAMQVDWGSCGRIQIGRTSRRISVLVAVMCYSRLCYIEFSLSERKADFYRCISNAVRFFGGAPRKIIFDNLKAAVIAGAGRHATFHPEFLELCGHYSMEPIACAARDPESKGMVETNVKYVKRNALKGRDDELTDWPAYRQLAAYWRDQVANVRIHDTTREKPAVRFEAERPVLRSLPSVPFSTDEVKSAVVSTHARVQFDSNRYSVPPKLARKTVLIRADDQHVKVIYRDEVVACHARCFERRQLICKDEHLLETRQLNRRQAKPQLDEAFAAMGPVAQAFLVGLLNRPAKHRAHLRRLVELAKLYGQQDVIEAMERAVAWETYDAAYVEFILHQHRRQRELPSPTNVVPRKLEWIDETEYEASDPANYDRLLDTSEE